MAQNPSVIPFVQFSSWHKLIVELLRQFSSVSTGGFTISFFFCHHCRNIQSLHWVGKCSVPLLSPIPLWHCHLQAYLHDLGKRILSIQFPGFISWSVHFHISDNIRKSPYCLYDLFQQRLIHPAFIFLLRIVRSKNRSVERKKVKFNLIIPCNFQNQKIPFSISINSCSNMAMFITINSFVCIIYSGLLVNSGSPCLDGGCDTLLQNPLPSPLLVLGLFRTWSIRRNLTILISNSPHISFAYS